MKEDTDDKIWRARNAPETTKVFTPSMSPSQSLLKLNKEYSIPVINHVAAENQQLTRQRELISLELKKVATLGQYLAQQNQKLRLHYHQRTNDVNKIIKTMQINTTENMNETEHTIHLLKESNCLVFKRIQEKSQEVQELDQQIQHMTKSITNVQGDNIKNQNERYNPIKAKLAGKLNSDYLRKLQAQRDDALRQEEYLLGEVGQLTILTTKLKKKNTEKVSQIQNGKIKNSRDKETYRGDIMHTIKSLSELKEEKDSLKIAAEKQRQSHEESEKRNLFLLSQVNELTSKKETQSSQLLNLQFNREREINMIKECQKQKATLEVEILKRNDEKESLESELSSKRKKLHESTQRMKDEKLKIERQYNQKIRQYKKKINLVEESHRSELKKIKEEIVVESERLQTLKQSYQNYESDLRDYNSVLGKLENPVNEIERSKMILKMEGKRQGLSRLAGF